MTTDDPSGHGAVGSAESRCTHEETTSRIHTHIYTHIHTHTHTHQNTIAEIGSDDLENIPCKVHKNIVNQCEASAFHSLTVLK